MCSERARTSCVQQWCGRCPRMLAGHRARVAGSMLLIDGTSSRSGSSALSMATTPDDERAWTVDVGQCAHRYGPLGAGCANSKPGRRGSGANEARNSVLSDRVVRRNPGSEMVDSMARRYGVREIDYTTIRLLYCGGEGGRLDDPPACVPSHSRLRQHC
nr:hypothetical protein CFP56_25829 [Quercus suber]